MKNIVAFLLSFVSIAAYACVNEGRLYSEHLNPSSIEWLKEHRPDQMNGSHGGFAYFVMPNTGEYLSFPLKDLRLYTEVKDGVIECFTAQAKEINAERNDLLKRAATIYFAYSKNFGHDLGKLTVENLFPKVEFTTVEFSNGKQTTNVPHIQLKEFNVYKQIVVSVKDQEKLASHGFVEVK